MLSESAGGALTTARNTETHFAARLYNIFNIVLLLHKLPGPLLTTAVNRHISSRLLRSPLLRHTAASPASPATSCPEGWTRCFFCLSTLSCVYTDSRHFSRGTVSSHSPRMFFFILICILSGFIFMMSAERPWSFVLPFSRYQPPLLLLTFGGLNFLWTPARFLLPCTTTGKSSLDSKWRIKKAKPNKKNPSKWITDKGIWFSKCLSVSLSERRKNSVRKTDSWDACLNVSSCHWHAGAHSPLLAPSF